MRRLRLALIACSAFVCLSALAAPPSRESVDALLSVVDMKKTYEASFEAIRTSMDKALSNAPQVQAMTSEQRQRFEAGLQRIVKLMHDDMDWDKLKPEFAQMYIDTFTQEEVDGLLAFYRTPAGHAMIEKMPILMGKMMQQTQARMQRLMPQIMQIAQDSAKDAVQETAKKP